MDGPGDLGIICGNLSKHFPVFVVPIDAEALRLTVNISVRVLITVGFRRTWIRDLRRVEVSVSIAHPRYPDAWMNPQICNRFVIGVFHGGRWHYSILVLAVPPQLIFLCSVIEFDCIVAGGGLAGATAARHLAQ